MSANKTRPNNASVISLLDKVEDQVQKRDSYTLIDIMKEITGEEPVIWGPSIIGFGSYHYKYDSGREGDMMLTGFSPRKQNLSLFIMAGFTKYEKLMQKLGKYKTGKSCLYIKRLSDINMDVLTELIKASYNHHNNKYNS
ncbi:MAG: DUF1801 domain-containing protein [Maribacter sp.]|nr:DUF1801 domain-containing protein [Maribacter sp.]